MSIAKNAIHCIMETLFYKLRNLSFGKNNRIKKMNTSSLFLVGQDLATAMFGVWACAALS